MFDRAGQIRSKKAAFVRLSVAGAPPFDAWVWVAPGERLVDLLNDPRGFIPVRRAGGETVILAKAVIEAAEEHDPSPNAEPGGKPEAGQAPLQGDDFDSAQAPGNETQGEAPSPSTGRRTQPLDPFDILRVARDASLEEVKRAYKARIKTVHPDAFAGPEGDEELSRAACRATQRVNAAYRKILRERFGESKNINGSGDESGAP